MINLQSIKEFVELNSNTLSLSESGVEIQVSEYVFNYFITSLIKSDYSKLGIRVFDVNLIRSEIFIVLENNIDIKINKYINTSEGGYDFKNCG